MKILNIIKGLFDNSASDQARSNLSTVLGVSNTILAAQETYLMYLILTATSPEFLFPFIVANIAITNVPAFLVPKNMGEKVNKVVGGITSTASAILALTVFKGSYAAIAFDTALGISTGSSLVDCILKYKHDSLTKLEATEKTINIIKNALIMTVITMGKQFGEISPGKVFETLKEQLPDDIRDMCIAAGGVTLVAGIMGLIHFTQKMVKACKANPVVESESDYRQFDSDEDALPTVRSKKESETPTPAQGVSLQGLGTLNI